MKWESTWAAGENDISFVSSVYFNDEQISVAQIGRPSRRMVRGMRATCDRGLSIMHHNIRNVIANANPGVAGAILLAAFIGLLTWAWLPAGFLLP